MDSSKRHWPSMFKSKSSVSSQGHQSQHDTSSLISTPTSTVSSAGTVEKAPEPKPRWNPKPEQIRILEGIFNSGMVTPPRDEIRRIRAQLEEYGEIGDANVFYWFQNKKSRSKNKKTSNFLNSTTKSRKRTVSKPNTSQLSYTSSSSSDKSLQKSSPGEFMPEPYSFHASQSTLVGGAIAGNAAVGTPLIRGLCSPQVISSNVDYVAQYNNSRHNLSECHGQTYGKCSAASVVVADLINHEAPNNYHKRGEDNDQMKMQRQLSYNSVTTTPTPISAQTILPPTVVSNINHIQAEGIRKCTVFINDVAFEVASGPFDVRGAFGEDAVLLHSSGQPVVTNQCGVTLHSLQHGAFYYLFRMRTPSSTSQTHGSASYMGIKENVPPYLDPTLSMEELMTGVSFASAGSGFDTLTATLTQVIPVIKQIDMFKEYARRIEVGVGKERAGELIKNALFVISAGTNDYVLNYYGPPIRSKTYTISAYHHFLLQIIHQFLQDLVNLGARKIVMAGVPPIECLPVVITLNSLHSDAFHRRSCIDSLSSVAPDHNQFLEQVLKNMQGSDLQLLYVDIHKPLRNILQNTKKFGFDDANSGCCGTGLLETSFMCNPRSSVCPDASSYVFFDSVHPTEKAYYIIFQHIIPVIDFLMRS